MAKDRFKTRASWDKEFKYGITPYSFKDRRTVTSQQTNFMRDLYYSDKLNSWEKNFVKSLLGFKHLTKKQKETLKKIYIKTSK